MDKIFEVGEWVIGNVLPLFGLGGHDNEGGGGGFDAAAWILQMQQQQAAENQKLQKIALFGGLGILGFMLAMQMGRRR